MSKDKLRADALELANLVVSDTRLFYECHDLEPDDVEDAMNSDTICKAAKRFIEEHAHE